MKGKYSFEALYTVGYFFLEFCVSVLSAEINIFDLFVFSEHDVGEDDIYDCVPCEDEGDDIYEDIIKVEVRQPMVREPHYSKWSLCACMCERVSVFQGMLATRQFGQDLWRAGGKLQL